MKQLLFSLVTATLMSWNAGATAAELNCPEPVGQLAQDVKADVQGHAQTLFKIGELQLTGQVQKTITNLFEKYPNADRVAIAQNILSQFCNFLKDSNLPDEKKAQLLLQLNEQVIKLMSPGGRSESDQKLVYVATEAGRSDLRTVRSYLPTETEGFTENGECWWGETDGTDEISVDDKKLVIRSSRSEDYGKCENFSPYYRHEDLWCTANISDLDEVLWVPPCCPPFACGKKGRLFINCLQSGMCVSCQSYSREWKKGREDQAKQERENLPMESFLVYFTTTRRDEKACTKLNDFARALSRIISGGSDEAFCKAHPSYCQQ